MKYIFCQTCGTDIPPNRQQHELKTCHKCQQRQQREYEELGIHAPYDENYKSGRQFLIRNAKELLTWMGYNVKEPIYPQFRDIACKKYGKCWD